MTKRTSSSQTPRPGTFLIHAIVLILLAASVFAQPQITRIMPLGNSITRGGGSTGEVGYRRPLYLKLDTAGYRVNFVGSLINGTFLDFDRDHEGHGSYRADQLRDTVYDWLDVNPARIVLLHIGINDIAGGNEDPAEVEGILDSIDLWEHNHAESVTVVVARIVLRWDGNDPETQVFNDSVEAIVQRRILAGDDLVMVDMEHALTYPDDLRDGVHPNDVGYAKMANVWYDALTALLPPPDTISGDILVSDVQVQPSSPDNTTGDSLLCSFQLGGLATTAATAWAVDDMPLMQLYAPFEGGADYALYDVSGSEHFLTPIGDMQWDSAGGFDGNGAWVCQGGYFDAGSWFPSLASYTKAAWIRVDGDGANNIVSGATGHAFGAATVAGASHLAAGHNGQWSQVFDGAPLTQGQWYHAAVTFDYPTGDLILYRDGVEVDRATLSQFDREITDSMVEVGAFADTGTFTGALDDVRLYGRALSSDQIALIASGDDTAVVPAETSPGENWRASVTPFSPLGMGASVLSNTLEVGLPLPYVSDVILQASSPYAQAIDSLFCNYTLEGGAVSAAVTWYRDLIPLAELYAPFEGGEATALIDYSGHGHNLAGSSDPMWDATGGHDGHGAFVLDGNDYLSAGDCFPTLSSYTKTAWVYRTDVGSSNILSGQTSAGGHVFFASTSSQNGCLAAGHNGLFNIVRDNVPLADSTWYFVALTFDYASGEMVLYRDGVEVDRATAGTDYRDVTDPMLYVGAFAASSQWVGTIDEPRVYASALSPEQIHALYTLGGRAITPDLTGGGEVWHAAVTPFSTVDAGPTVESNSLTIGVDQLTPPACAQPPNRPDSILFTLTPTFEWAPSISPYIGYSIYYRIMIGLDPTFLFRFEQDSLISPQYTWFDSLEIDRQYWWTVTAWVDVDGTVVSARGDTLTFWTWTPADLDHSRSVNITDLTILVSFLFQGGDTPDPFSLADVDGDCAVNVSDLTLLVAYLFQGGTAPTIGCAQ